MKGSTKSSVRSGSSKNESSAGISVSAMVGSSVTAGFSVAVGVISSASAAPQMMKSSGAGRLAVSSTGSGVGVVATTSISIFGAASRASDVSGFVFGFAEAIARAKRITRTDRAITAVR